MIIFDAESAPFMARLLEEEYIQLRNTIVYFDDGHEKHQVISATRFNNNQEINESEPSVLAGYYLEMANSHQLTLNIHKSDNTFIFEKKTRVHNDTTQLRESETRELTNWINSGVNVFLF
ncbi:hypothetical protein VIBNISO65_p0155 [Vibrio nigripulchritudo SO65]|uniref:hypothetical protein n=1 Tax=Vibrio nigripulchritudo TaxID=28173 RepID=UPI0003B23793|nr:hypothetical protein [Vibrio nigripulchritudo]CCN38736.1 hypothetical protein VIBNIAM115_p0153 [Vibrio nigripulchritudo AM115]CCN45043.1 hypothetical protein VIBNIFTn2_p0152 [Vibrio nigripulchritudo FTn2]CCN79802.1 hypothetical protein VIBNISO65_p0155 [Vibrio nigripulchritudo SO65]